MGGLTAPSSMAECGEVSVLGVALCGVPTLTGGLGLVV